MSLRKSARRAPLQFQTLEQRENPAGNIVTSVAGGVLTLTGTDQAENFNIRQITGDKFTITGISGTTIDGVANATTAVAATSVKMFLKGGDDSVTLDPSAALTLAGSLSIDGGDGNNGVKLFTTASAISLKDFTYVGGDGLDSVILGQAGTASTVGGPVSLTPGNGGSNISITNTTVNGELWDKAGVGTDLLTLTAVTAKKNVNVDFGTGGGLLTTQTTTVITGGLSYKALDGDDTISLADTTVNGPAGVKINGGLGDANLTTAGAVAIPAGGLSLAGINGLSNVNVSGTLTMPGDLKVNNLGVSVSNSGTITDGNLTLIGADSVNVNSTGVWNVHKNLSFAATSPIGSVDATFAALNLDGNLTATATQSDSFNIASGLVKGSVFMTGKSDEAVLRHTNSGRDLEIQKGVTLKSDGDATMALDSTGKCKVGGDISLTSTTGFATMANTAGDMTLLGGIKVSGKFSANVSFASPSATGGTVAKDVTLTSAPGNAVAGIFAAKLTLNGKLTLNAGVDALLAGTSLGTVTFNKDVTVNGKYHDSTVLFDGSNNEVFGGKLTLTGGNNATINLFNTGTTSAVAGDVSVTAGRGAAVLLLQQSSFSQLPTSGKAFNGNVVLKGYQTNLYQNTSSVTTFAKNLTLTGGNGNDTGTMKGLYTVTGDAMFNLGEGSNSVDLSSSDATTDFAGKLTVKTGNDSDTIRFVNVQAAKDVSVISLAGDDLISVDGGSVFAGAFTADTGAGDDTIDLGITTNLMVKAATFTGKVTIKTGAGNDKLRLGTNGGDGNSVPVFGTLGSTIDGGTGFNLYDPLGVALPFANLTVTGF